MPRPRQNLNYGGNRVSGDGGTPVKATATVKADRHVIRYESKYGNGVCPVCEEVVHLLKRGVIGKHSIGSSRKNSWLCPGYEQEPKT